MVDIECIVSWDTHDQNYIVNHIFFWPPFYWIAWDELKCSDIVIEDSSSLSWLLTCVRVRVRLNCFCWIAILVKVIRLKFFWLSSCFFTLPLLQNLILLTVFMIFFTLKCVVQLQLYVNSCNMFTVIVILPNTYGILLVTPLELIQGGDVKRIFNTWWNLSTTNSAHSISLVVFLRLSGKKLDNL